MSSNQEKLKQWEEILEKSETLHLTVLDGAGYPLMYPMEKVSNAGLSRVFFITKKQSEKVHALTHYEKCSIECHIEEKILWLFGTMDIITESSVIRQILPESYWNRLMRHENFADYCVLAFHTQEAKGYENGRKRVLPIKE